MNNDSRDDRDPPEPGDSDRQLEFEDTSVDRDEPEAFPSSTGSFSAFNSDQATELDDLEAEDFGTEYFNEDEDYDEGADAFIDDADDVVDNVVEEGSEAESEDDGEYEAEDVVGGPADNETEGDEETLDIWDAPDDRDDADRLADTADTPAPSDPPEDEIDIWADTESAATDINSSTDTHTETDWPVVDDEEGDGEEDDWPEEPEADLDEVESDSSSLENAALAAAAAPDLSSESVSSTEAEDEAGTPESWQLPLDDEQWDDGNYADPGAEPEGWPIGLIVVAVIALLLLAGGGYGVMQQRAAMQEEIRELRAQLATAANPADVTNSRDAQRQLEESNSDLQGRVESLTLENQQLTETITGLESQLEAQRLAAIKLEEARAAARKQSAASSSPASAPAPSPKPAATATGSSGLWFVNFGSYSQQSVASDWATRLQKTYGRVVVAPASANGKTVYRVRVVDVSSKARAEQISAELQQQYKLPTLWVGRQ